MKIKELTCIYFSLDKNDINYNEEFSMMRVYIDYNKHAVVTELISRWNSSYNETNYAYFGK